MPDEKFSLTVTVPEGTLSKITDAHKSGIAAAVMGPLAEHFKSTDLLANASDLKVDCCDKLR